MDRWIKYKNNYFNLSTVRIMHVDRADKEMRQWNEKIGAGKEKPYILFIDHNGIAAFAKREEGEKVADDIINGRYDCKK